MVVDMTLSNSTAARSAVQVRTVRDLPDLAADLVALAVRGWPAFVLASDVATRCWPSLFNLAPELQFGVFDEDSGELLAAGHAVPCAWDGTEQDLPAGWDDVLERGVEQQSHSPNAVSALSIVVAPEHRSRGLSRIALQVMGGIVRAAGFTDLIAPVRPTRKHLYPLIPTEQYIRWRNEGGRVFDPWLRVHDEAGGKILQVAESSMIIEGTIEQWRAWTGVELPGAGRHVVPDALVPITVHRRLGLGRYVEPNVWVHHDLRAGVPS